MTHVLAISAEVIMGGEDGLFVLIYRTCATKTGSCYSKAATNGLLFIMIDLFILSLTDLASKF